MKLHNTLTKKLDIVKPIHDNVITMYSCGPTLYDHSHIGNLSSFIYADTLKRVLKSTGFKVKHVMNYTDVDDKMIAKSRERYPNEDPNVALKMLANEYRQKFLDDMQAVGNQIDDIEFLSATDNVDKMQKLINRLLKDKFAYIADDGIYFSIDAYKKSGKKYGQLTEVSSESTSSARIRNDEYDKDNAHDFALWKFAIAGDPSWDYLVGGQNHAGRPGWHIECSAMSTDALGQPFDIHTGGIDLIFPHHENEIAQSTAGQKSDKMANIFWHNEHLLVDGKKMSKSLNNFYTLEDIKEKGIDPLAFRLFVLQSHHRHQSNFTWENLESAQNRLKAMRATAVLRWQTAENVEGSTYVLNEFISDLLALAAGDINFPAALSEISVVFGQLDTLLIDSNTKNRYNNVRDFNELLKEIDSLMGMNLLGSDDITDEQKSIIKARDKARDENDWKKADELRDKLKQDGIELRDTPKGSVWSRT